MILTVKAISVLSCYRPTGLHAYTLTNYPLAYLLTGLQANMLTCYMSVIMLRGLYGYMLTGLQPNTLTTTTTTFITYSTSYSEKFVHPNIARLIKLGGTKIK